MPPADLAVVLHQASSTGLLLKTLGLKVTAIKIDPYMNIDAGTMAPTEHGEVYVLNDGGEVDLDLGNYERYLDVTLSRENNITTGKVYRDVIDREVRFAPLSTPHTHSKEVRADEEDVTEARRLPGQDGADRASPHDGDPGLDRARRGAARRRHRRDARRVHRRAWWHGRRH